MSDPILLMNTQKWYSDHDPGASETCNAGAISQYDDCTNDITGRPWLNIDPTVDALKWLPKDGVIASDDINLSLGTATVSCTAITSTTSISLEKVSAGGTSGAVFVSAITSGVGFTITSTSLLDSSKIRWKVHSY